MTDREVINDLNKMLKKATEIIEKYEKAIEDIKAEIEAVRMNAIGGKNMEYAKGLETAWNIIDKHIGGSEDADN